MVVQYIYIYVLNIILGGGHAFKPEWTVCKRGTDLVWCELVLHKQIHGESLRFAQTRLNFFD